MAEYIEREAAIKICSGQYKECLRKSDWCGDTVAWNIGFLIKQIPAADVVEVVRCAECEYWNTEEKSFYGVKCRCERFTLGSSEIYTCQHDFCSYGERKETDEHGTV